MKLLHFSKLRFELYGDFFVNGTFSNQSSHKISEILYNYNRTNQFAINLAYLKSSYVDTHFRYHLAFMTGSYGDDNYAEETELFKNLLEGNVGFKLSKTKNEWLDIGVMGSHIGFESAIGYECWFLTRSLLSENSPFYETGIKYTYTSSSEKWTHSFMLLNGWQRISMIAGHTIPALGMQFTYRPHTKVHLNYSNFLGSVRPDSMWALRTYHNFFMTYASSSKMQWVANFDIGSDKNQLDEYVTWYGAFLGLKYLWHPRHILTYRMEFLKDPNDILYPQFNRDWLVWATSVNYDYQINSFTKLRGELKYMNSSQPMFLPNYSEHLGAFIALQIKI